MMVNPMYRLQTTKRFSVDYAGSDGQPPAHTPALDEIALLIADEGYVEDRLIRRPWSLPVVMLKPL